MHMSFFTVLGCRIGASGIRLSIMLVLLTSGAMAQRADPASSDQNGDFHSSLIEGNRGPYQQRYWLVVDPDPNGLNCRSNTGVVDRFYYGDLLAASLDGNNDNAIVTVAAKTFLRVVDRRGIDGPVKCKVRANARFIAPINTDDLTQLLNESFHR